MNSSTEDKPSFESCIDYRHEPEKSVVLRYMNAVTFRATPEEDKRYKDYLMEISLREGARIFPLLTHKGVEVYIMDETSLMHTRTLKSIDGCVSMAHCKAQGHDRVILESGGNTGTAFTEYGQRAGIETFLFLPKDNLQLLNSRSFKAKNSHLIAVEDAGMVKKVAHLFSDLNGIIHIPEIHWRYQASMLRGSYILEYMLKNGRFDWITQTISAAFGPIGIYRILDRFKEGSGDLPRFMGVQQEANCPIYRAWKSHKAVEPIEIASTEQLLTRVMYDARPHTYGSFDEFKDLLTSLQGDLTTVNRSEFNALLERNFNGKRILTLLRDNGIDITVKNGDVVEKTGLISLTGTIKEIDKGIIPDGSNVLCCITSGATEADGAARPEFEIREYPERMVREYSRKVFG
jgi:hypothetical protein